jgi:hypothetical protein
LLLSVELIDPAARLERIASTASVAQSSLSVKPRAGHSAHDMRRVTTAWSASVALSRLMNIAAATMGYL